MILRELKRLGKRAEYLAAKKQIVESLGKDRWTPLAGLILREGSDFVAECMETDKTGSALAMQVEELATSSEVPASRTEKFKSVPHLYRGVESCLRPS